MITGYYGNSDTNEITKTHIIKHSRPICGAQIGPDMELLWISRTPSVRYVTCKSCLRIQQQHVYNQKRVENEK
jgi:hypothetical protein